MAQVAIRKANRIRNLWPSRAQRPPPSPTSARVPAAPSHDETLPLRSLTAHELIAMARAARARSLEG